SLRNHCRRGAHGDPLDTDELGHDPIELNRIVPQIRCAWSHFLRRTGVHFGGKCFGRYFAR
ncbi:MAG TPA: hypothetical protein VFS85_07380, partial [Dongiaceae bacterium]|nr:hypothetical protein [Dongiaceae bacterium]